MYQNHLKGLVQHRNLDHIPRGSDSVGLGFPDESSVVEKVLLPMQKTQVQSLMREDPVYLGTTEPLLLLLLSRFSRVRLCVTP